MKPLFVISEVVKGFGRGSKDLGCPTSNMDNSSELGIPNGIYCGFAQLCIDNESQVQKEDGFDDDYSSIVTQLPKVFPVKSMVCSYGFNPQYGNKERVLEVHILEKFNFNFYGATLRVLICKWLRDEQKYNSLEELKEAIANDIENGRREAENFTTLAESSEYFLIPPH